MSEIRVISTSTVRPPTDATLTESTHRIELTPWDLVFLQVHTIQKGLLFLKPKLQPNNLIDHLKTSLSRTLHFFPPLAGRLAATVNDDTTTSFFINCNNAGAEFTHATVDYDLTVADILDPPYVPKIVHSFFPLNGVLNREGIFKPLLAVQVTELVDGFFIGCTINHSVADGTSFWHFFNSWSEISRGLSTISKPPQLKRWFPDDIKFNYPIRIPSWDESEIYIPPLLKERVFHFSRESIAKLKAKANAEMGTDRISSLQALLAHLWRSVIRCRRSDADEDINFKFLIGARPRLRPPLAEGYFGSAVHIGAVNTTAGELMRQGLGWVAWEMHKMIASQTEEQVRKIYESWAKSPTVSGMGAMVTNALTVSSSPQFNMYGNDFGWGKPVAVRSGAGNKFDGKITLFPGVEEKSVDIEACLLPETLHAMSDDEEFMEAITI